MDDEVLDRYSCYSKRDNKIYPHLYFDNPPIEMNLIVSSLEEGNLPIVVKFPDKDNPKEFKEIELAKRIKNTPECVSKLLYLSKFNLFMSEDKSFEVEKISDMMDIVEYSWT